MVWQGKRRQQCRYCETWYELRQLNENRWLSAVVGSHARPHRLHGVRHGSAHTVTWQRKHDLALLLGLAGILFNLYRPEWGWRHPLFGIVAASVVIAAMVWQYRHQTR